VPGAAVHPPPRRCSACLPWRFGPIQAVEVEHPPLGRDANPLLGLDLPAIRLHSPRLLGRGIFDRTTQHHSASAFAPAPAAPRRSLIVALDPHHGCSRNAGMVPTRILHRADVASSGRWLDRRLLDPDRGPAFLPGLLLPGPRLRVGERPAEERWLAPVGLGAGVDAELGQHGSPRLQLAPLHQGPQGIDMFAVAPAQETFALTGVLAFLRIKQDVVALAGAAELLQREALAEVAGQRPKAVIGNDLPHGNAHDAGVA